MFDYNQTIDNILIEIDDFNKSINNNILPYTREYSIHHKVEKNDTKLDEKGNNKVKSLMLLSKMYKVRQNKEADFEDLFIDDNFEIDKADVDKPSIVYKKWKELDEEEQNIIINKFIDDEEKKYNLRDEDKYNLFELIKSNEKYINFNKIQKTIKIDNLVFYKENEKNIYKINYTNSSKIKTLRKVIKLKR